jgi:hypothetical protein
MDYSKGRVVRLELEKIKDDSKKDESSLKIVFLFKAIPPLVLYSW